MAEIHAKTQSLGLRAQVRCPDWHVGTVRVLITADSPQFEGQKQGVQVEIKWNLHLYAGQRDVALLHKDLPWAGIGMVPVADTLFTQQIWQFYSFEVNLHM